MFKDRGTWRESSFLRLLYQFNTFSKQFLENVELFSLSGDLKDEVAVLAWLLDDNNRELDDAIESVNFKMLDKLLDTSPFVAVFFCKISNKKISHFLKMVLIILCKKK